MIPLLLALGLVAAQSEPRDVQEALRHGARLEAAGETQAALERYRFALEHAAPHSVERADALQAVSLLETAIGQYASAIRHAREAAAIYESRADRRGQAQALNRAGRASTYAGQYADAEDAFQAAIRLSAAEGHREGQAEQLGNLGGVYMYLGRYSDALRRLDQALAIADAPGAESWAPRRRRILLGSKAALFLRLGRYQQALALYQELGATSQGVPPQEHAQLLLNVGVLYRRLNDPAKALATYDEAMKWFERGRHAYGELIVLKNRGIILALELGRADEAERSFTRVIEEARRIGNPREMLVAHLFRGETLLRAGRRDRAADDFGAALALARELGVPEEEWKALFGLGRSERRPDAATAYLTEAVAVIEALRERIKVPSLRSDFFHDKREVYDALIAARLGTASASDLFSLIERGHSRAWRDRLNLSGAVDVASVQRALPANALLLDYWSSPHGSAVAAVTRTRAAVIPVPVQHDQVRTLHDTLAARTGAAWRPHAENIARLVLPPADWFNGVEHVVVVPDGVLALIPFEILPAGGRLLIERAAISYTPTAAALLRPSPSTRSWSPPWKLQLEAFGDPIFASGTFEDAAPLRGRLAASLREVRDVASEIGGTAALHVGPENRKARLYAEGERAPILHLATHAVADENAMEQSRILFSPAVASGSNADYLFLAEAYTLPLTGVELAVLSACDTERGPALRGDGVQSFSRAFLAAGARSTVTTLWRVADGPTADLMRVFYHHLQRGLTRDEALRRAKLRFLESGSALAHPHFWAAFVLTGDGMRPVPRALTWRAVGLAGLLLAASVWAFWVRRGRRPRRVAAAHA